MKQEMMGWQWHQLDHMQIICTSRQTDNHASTSFITHFLVCDLAYSAFVSINEVTLYTGPG